VALQELAVDLATELATVRRTLAGNAGGRLEAAVERALLLAARARRREELRAAAVGARRIEWRALRTGSAHVRIDEGAWFTLCRVDARLLRVLATTPPDGDGFPKWQTYETVAQQAAGKAGPPPTRRAIIESVYRIRQAFRAADLNPFLIEVDRRAGRLRLRLQMPDHVAAAPRMRAKDA
jgi:hypothetical protein